MSETKRSPEVIKVVEYMCAYCKSMYDHKTTARQCAELKRQEPTVEIGQFIETDNIILRIDYIGWELNEHLNQHDIRYYLTPTHWRQESHLGWNAMSSLPDSDQRTQGWISNYEILDQETLIDLGLAPVHA